MKIVHILKDGRECSSISGKVIKQNTNELLYFDLLKIERKNNYDTSKICTNEQRFNTKNATAIPTSKNRPCEFEIK